MNQDPCRFQTTASPPARLAAQPATGDGTTPIWTKLSELTLIFPQAVAGRSAPRVLTLTGDYAWDAAISWLGGGGVGGTAWLTVPKYARIALDARDLRVYAWNRANAENSVTVAIADGEQTTRNSWVVEWAGDNPPAAGAITVPPFAQTIQAFSTAASVAVVELQNAYGNTVGRVPITDLAAGGALVAGAAKVALSGLAAGEIVTLAFGLGV